MKRTPNILPPRQGTRVPCLCCVLLLVGASSPFVHGSELRTSCPSRIELLGPGAIQHLLVEDFEGNLATRDVTDSVSWSCSDDGICRVDQGVLIPLSDGRTILTATTPQGTASVPVQVSAMSDQTQWEFRRHVLPILARAGCNMGACHGALAGKGGFKLSLRGYYPEGDYQAIVREARGRRIELSDPGRSLLLVKPTGVLPHKGGLRLEPQSRDYQIVSGWIQAGAAPNG